MAPKVSPPFFLLKYSAVLMMILWIPGALSQEKELCGIVLDEKTGLGIPDANLYIVGTLTGCTSDKTGAFCLVTKTFPAEIIISHLGYESRKLLVNDSQDGLRVSLRPVAKLLHEIEVVSESGAVPFFKDEHYAVLDYEIDHDIVYLLIYRARLSRAELLCIYIDGDTVARSGILPFKPAGLFLDCMNYIHVLSKDSSYQVFLDADTLLFPYSCDIKRFRSLMTECVASTDSWLFFREESLDHLMVNFYRVNRKTKERQDLASVSDAEKWEMMKYNPSDRYFLNMDTLPNSYNQIIEWAWINKILYKSNTSAMQKIGDTLAIFNSSNGEMDLYDLNGSHIAGLSIHLDQAGKGEWTKTIYFDPVTKQPYTSFLKNGRLTLYHVDLPSGDMKRISDADHLFPQKVKIHNNCFFYLYDIPGQGDNKQLFMKKIENTIPSLTM